MDIKKLFEAKSRQLFWRQLDPTHVIGLESPELFVKDESYVIIRMVEMYLATARKLWHQLYPLLHSYIECGKFQRHAISGPSQLRELGDANLDRISNLNQILAGPMPFDGEEVSLLAGLYSVPGHDSARALIDTLGALAVLPGSNLGEIAPVAQIVKTGIESILGLDEATLHLGVRDSFASGSDPFGTGYFVAIAAADLSVDPAQLWLANGRLLKGPTQLTSKPYSDHDYMVLSVERMQTRDDWHTLDGIAPMLARFSTIMSDVGFTIVEKRSRLATLWPPFVQMLNDSPQLTQPDRDRILAIVGNDYAKRLAAQEDGNPFVKKVA
jgi:hypothetical protein